MVSFQAIAALALVFQVTATCALKEDEFDGNKLNTSIWTAYNPDAANVAVRQERGIHFVDLREGKQHHMWHKPRNDTPNSDGWNYAYRIYQALRPSEKYEVQVKFNTQPKADQKYQEYGLFVGYDRAETSDQYPFHKFGCVSAGDGTYVFHHAIRKTSYTDGTSKPVTECPDRFRIKYDGNTYKFSIINKGKSTVQLISDKIVSDAGKEPKFVGIYVANTKDRDLLAPAFSTGVRYFTVIYSEYVRKTAPQELCPFDGPFDDPCVVDGGPTRKKEFPFFVDWGGCGGSLIHEDIVLTAGHCEIVRETKDAFVGAYREGFVTSGTEKLEIQTRRIHPNFVYTNTVIKYDVMVLKLVPPSTIIPVELNGDSKQPRTNANVTAMGHGWTIPGNASSSSSSTLLKITVPRISDEACKRAYQQSEFKFFSKTMLCAGFLQEGDELTKGTCHGDSGGPLVENRGNRPVQVGVTSFGDGCASPEFPGVYAKVSKLKSWIDDQVCVLSTNPPESCKARTRFYGQVWLDNNGNYEIDESESNPVNPIATTIAVRNAEVRLMRVFTKKGKQVYDRIKTSKINKDGYWLISLNKVLDGQFYIKVVLNNAGYDFVTKAGDSDVDDKGNSDRMNIVKGGNYEVNAGISRKSGGAYATVLLSYAAKVNIGGPNYTDIFGTVWTGYVPFHSGTSFNRSNSIVIDRTNKQGLYRSELYFDQEDGGDLPMVLEIPIPQGEYHVRLHFAEIWKRSQNEGAHVFDVFIEGSLVWKNLDIFKEVGGGYTALVKETQTTLTDCSLTVAFKSVKGNLKLSAINVCTITTVDFNEKADGTLLEPGLYVADEWLKFGMTVSSLGGVGDLPRLFDTTFPKYGPECGGSDLGAPNRACPSSGPGVGAGGAPGKPGENCDFLGNVLIVQEENDSDCPDDNRSGGTITFDFVNPALAVYEMGFLDIDDVASVEVLHFANRATTTIFELPNYGNNSKQTLTINIENVMAVKVTFEKSGAVTHIKFCRKDQDTEQTIAKARKDCPIELLPKEWNPIKTSDSVHVVQERSIVVP